MDKLPRLRRKLKPPAIETSVERMGSDDNDNNNNTITANEGHRPVGADYDVTVTEPSSQKSPMKHSPLRNLKLRATAKRARTQSPVSRPLSRPLSSPVVAVFNQDGTASRFATDATTSFVNGRGHPRPAMPAFLNTSSHDLETKFQELMWTERNRLAQGTRPDAPLNRWASFKQTDGPPRGLMDRYFNIKPWNHNRVKLNVADDKLDYVNASAITLDSLRDTSLPPLRYIAMQGPTLPSFTYVWRMIAEQTASPAVIVQLTSMVEGGVIKCHQYFPDGTEEPTWMLNEQNIWNDNWKAQLTYASRHDVADGAIEKRKLLLHVDGESEPRVVWHLLYTRWPDFGVPTLDNMQSFLDLMQISRDHNEPSHPRIIHCSAGVGRTGTFICLEHLMRELEAGSLTPGLDNQSGSKQQDPIYDTVDHLRQQRRCMVQSEAQYHFLYDVMRRLWQEKYGLVPEDHAGVLGTTEPASKRLEVAGSPIRER